MMHLNTIIATAFCAFVPIAFEREFALFLPHPNIRRCFTASPKTGFFSRVHSPYLRGSTFWTASYSFFAKHGFKFTIANRTYFRDFSVYPSRCKVAFRRAVFLFRHRLTNIKCVAALWALFFCASFSFWTGAMVAFIPRLSWMCFPAYFAAKYPRPIFSSNRLSAVFAWVRFWLHRYIVPLNPEYASMAERRINNEAPMFNEVEVI